VIPVSRPGILRHSVLVNRPLILVTPSTSPAGAELPDHAISLACWYMEALSDAGGLPLCLPLTTDPGWIADAVKRADGVLITGGDDIDPHIYWREVPEELIKTCYCAEPDRDTMELQVIEEVLRQRCPLLAICRGHQLVNVALGGTLYVDLPTQHPGPIDHCQLEKRCEVAHRISVVLPSNFARIVGRPSLEVNTTHHQAISRLAAPLQAVGIAPDGIIEATEFTDAERHRLPWFQSVQFHPERLFRKHPEHGELFKAFVAACRNAHDRG